MKTLIRNALIVTMNEQTMSSKRRDRHRRQPDYVTVGPAEWTPAGPFDKTIEAGRMIAMPGMVNAHCHSPANLVRGMMPSKPLEIWRAYYRASLRDMREDDFYASAILGGMEMLKNGATTVLDHFAGKQACRFMGAGAAIQAMRDLGLRHVAALTMTDKNYEDTIPLGQTDCEPDRRDQAHERERSEIHAGLARRVRRVYRDFSCAGKADNGMSRPVGRAALHATSSDKAAPKWRARRKLPHAYSSRRNQSAGGAGVTASTAIRCCKHLDSLGVIGRQSFLRPFDLDRRRGCGVVRRARRNAGA